MVGDERLGWRGDDQRNELDGEHRFRGFRRRSRFHDRRGPEDHRFYDGSIRCRRQRGLRGRRLFELDHDRGLWRRAQHGRRARSVGGRRRTWCRRRERGLCGGRLTNFDYDRRLRWRAPSRRRSRRSRLARIAIGAKMRR
jgi:hypothetical protein